MSKRTTIFLSLLALVTAILSVLFISVSFCVDFFFDSKTASMIFEEVRTAFDLIAEFTALGIVIYSFCRYTPKNASRSIFIAIGSILLSFIFQIIATAAFEFTTSAEASDVIWESVLMFSLFGTLGLVVERILPCLLIAFIAFLCTRNLAITKAARTVGVVKTIGLSSLVIYLVNAVPALILHIIELVSIGGTSQLYAEEFMLNYVVPHLLILVYNGALVFGVFGLVYFICKKFEDGAPIKRKKTNTPLEEK